MTFEAKQIQRRHRKFLVHNKHAGRMFDVNGVKGKLETVNRVMKQNSSFGLHQANYGCQLCQH